MIDAYQGFLEAFEFAISNKIVFSDHLTWMARYILLSYVWFFYYVVVTFILKTSPIGVFFVRYSQLSVIVKSAVVRCEKTIKFEAFDSVWKQGSSICHCSWLYRYMSVPKVNKVRRNEVQSWVLWVYGPPNTYEVGERIYRFKNKEWLIGFLTRHLEHHSTSIHISHTIRHNLHMLT